MQRRDGWKNIKYNIHTESAYQAQKCKDKAEQKLFEKFSADEAKRLGRKIEYREDWDSVKIPIMKKLSRTNSHKIKYCLSICYRLEILQFMREIIGKIPFGALI